MNLSIGLVGLPNAGKSTLFQALTSQNVLIADYPFATIEPNFGLVPIVDPRLKVLSKIFDSQKLVPAQLEFVDIAGLIEGAHQGEGLGNQFLSHIRQSALIVQVVGCFAPADVRRDLEVITTELLLADWQTLNKQVEKLKKPASADVELKNLLNTIERALQEIDRSVWLGQSPQAAAYRQALRHLNLLTLKPRLFVFNLKANDLSDRSRLPDLESLAKTADYVCLSAALENELSQLPEGEREEFLKAYDLEESGLQRLVQTCLRTLRLQTFLTAGPKETRAWLIPRSCPAPEAAGVIHGDLQKGFIAAEIAKFEDLSRLGSWPAVKAAGLCRVEGKDYLMEDGDVVNFRFNL